MNVANTKSKYQTHELNAFLSKFLFCAIIKLNG